MQINRPEHILWNQKCALCDVYVAQRTPLASLIPNSIPLTQYTRHAATAPTQRNEVNHWVFLNCNFRKEQCMLPEDDRVIETYRSVSSVLMRILDH